ncbi:MULTISPECIES: DUF4190 domain-containing protein [unclassified Paenibacillus]|uniref:DUF4190 domain-containing protein n=1 Tax=unclassified Paenibacillus TaxID=185978 RepID=UPI0007BF47C2|nr:MULTISPECIES: DUF4190 domain-containing protein [unclassified Paenibacillus]SEB03318.1 protein of unknown function [Paenibacillus sp. 276b]SHN81048.1 protein of unknown function [Paenibacillus sp. ov031]
MDQRHNDVDRYYSDPLPPPPYVVPKTNSKSIAALVLGILSVIIPYLGFLIGIVAIVFASISLKEIKLRMEQGRGLAIAGLVCGIIGTAIYAIIILFILAAAFFYVSTDISTY